MSFSPDGHTFLTESENGIILWRADTIDELVAWTKANRVVAELSCDLRRIYSVTPLCSGDAQVQVPLTPFATATIPAWTPIVSPTASDTPTPFNIQRLIYTPTVSITPSITPTPGGKPPPVAIEG